jgi:acetyl esterase/lipase
VIGNLQTDAAWCRHICNQSKIMVIDVDYRLAPEFRFPTAMYDCWDAVRWVSERNSWGRINDQYLWK